MVENHRDKIESNSISTGDVRWVLNKKSKLLVPKHTKRTGFEDKTRWDRIQFFAQIIGAIAIPLSIIALIVSVWQFNAQQNYDSQRTAQQNQVEFQNLKDQQQQTILEAYLDRMQELLTSDHLGDPNATAEVRALARARTLTALSILNSDRKRVIIQFLYEAALINSKPIVDLTDADLSNAHLNNINLTDANLSGANLRGADLREARLEGVVLHEANLYGANLRGTDFYGADLIGANLASADLGCISLSPGASACTGFRDTNLRGTLLSNTDLRGLDLADAHFGCTNLNIHIFPPCTILFNADLRNAFFRYANLPPSVDLRGVDLTLARLDRVDLHGINLGCIKIGHGTYCNDLRGTNLSDANLSGTNLSGVYFGCVSYHSTTCTDLRHTILRGAILTGTYLGCGFTYSTYCTDFGGADLRNANLSGAYLGCEFPNSFYCTGLKDSNLSGANLSSADLSGVDFRGANLSGANLKYSKVTNNQLASVLSLQGATMPDGSIHP